VKLKYLCQKLQEKCDGKSLSKHEIALEYFIISGIDISKVTSMIYNIYKNNGKGIGISEGKPNGISLKACCECIKEGLKTYFVPEGVESEPVVQSKSTTRNVAFCQGQKPWQNAESLGNWTFATSFARSRITSKSAHRK